MRVRGRLCISIGTHVEVAPVCFFVSIGVHANIIWNTWHPAILSKGGMYIYIYISLHIWIYSYLHIGRHACHYEHCLRELAASDAHERGNICIPIYVHVYIYTDSFLHLNLLQDRTNSGEFIFSTRRDIVRSPKLIPRVPEQILIPSCTSSLELFCVITCTRNIPARGRRCHARRAFWIRRP